VNLPIHELRNPDEAALYLTQGLWLQRVVRPQAELVPEILSWALEIAGSGEPLPPVGFLADVGQLLLQAAVPLRHDDLPIPGWPAGLARVYEDHVLGKLYTDGSFERAGDALRRYQGRARIRGLAFVISQSRQRAGFGGVHLSPAVVKSVLAQPRGQVLPQGWEALSAQGPLPILLDLYEELALAVRNTGNVLGPEDVFELEHGTALAPFSQRVALRQVLQASAALEARLPSQRPRPLRRRHDVATRILDEDVYPVGGFASISNRGSIESLLHSQLALMEPNNAERPDLFDIRYLRDELLYYSRDENQFLRRRQTFIFAFDPDLTHTRFKDEHLPWQRIILVLGLTLAALRKLLDWLSTDALTFELLFLGESDSSQLLQAERDLLEMVLREQIANGAVVIAHLPRARLAARCAERARRSLCHCLIISTADRPFEADDTRVARLVISDAEPWLMLDDDTASSAADEGDPLSGWTGALEGLLQYWQ
jgi:hypothetical protein